MEQNSNVFAWAFSLIAEVLILKNLVHLVENENHVVKGFDVIITAPFNQWIFSLLIGIWILILAQRYNKEVEKKEKKSIYTILFLLTLILLTIASLKFLDIDTFRKGSTSPALICLGLAHLSVLLIDLTVYNPKESSAKKHMKYLKENDILFSVIRGGGLRMFSGLGLIIYGIMPCDKFESMYLLFFLFFLLILIIVYDLVSGTRKLVDQR